ncbi:MAG: hypothetical protein WC650_05305 [Candidatus Doudnabacteria bacterium]
MSSTLRAQNKKSGLASWIILFVIGVVIVGGLIFVAFFWPKGEKTPAASSLLQNPSFAVNTEEVFYSLMGKITEIQDGALKVQAKKEQNYFLSEDTDFTAELQEDTRYSRRVIPSNPDDPLKTEDIFLSDLKVGDEVNIVAGENINGKNTFTAAAVQVVEIQPVK